MTTVELIYDLDCPNIGAARQALLSAFAGTGVDARWREWNRADEDSPSYVRRFGSPTILVEGKDVAGMSPGDDPCCRVYPDNGGYLTGAPPVAAIERALRREDPRPRPPRAPGFVSALPAVGTALLPKLTCPVCWPAYAALLAALGVNFVDYTPYLPLLVSGLLAINLAILGWQAWQSSWWNPLLIGLLGAVSVWVGKFSVGSDFLVYLGTAALVLASVLPWLKQRSKPACGCNFPS